ncbi:GIY-YIG nuclease family protein, partial [Micrococcus luteus]|nr:GIY-YIG nuclease family protein [Micrococcus luteus]MCV7634557.1 GIY-YIG nuclease family protein [Micrococcus luteus]
PVLEIADPTTEAFPGFDHVLLSYGDLQSMVTETRYAGWRTALEAVRGIYLIADETAGQCYVGKADGERGVLGRWEAYARDGHGGNVALRDALELDPAQPERYTFSLLRVFGSNTPPAQIDAAEKHYKEALMTRRFGLNRN